MKFKRTLLLFLAMAVTLASVNLGGTIAWFTDRVSSNNNSVQSGDLSVALLDSAGEDASGKALFQNILWEPGAMAYEALTVKNTGNLALKYFNRCGYGLP